MTFKASVARPDASEGLLGMGPRGLVSAQTGFPGTTLHIGKARPGHLPSIYVDDPEVSELTVSYRVLEGPVSSRYTLGPVVFMPADGDSLLSQREFVGSDEAWARWRTAPRPDNPVEQVQWSVARALAGSPSTIRLTITEVAYELRGDEIEDHLGVDGELISRTVNGEMCDGPQVAVHADPVAPRPDGSPGLDL